MTGVLYSMSERPENFDLSVWSDFINSRIRSVLNARINDLKHGLKILGTQLVPQFAFCYTTCHSAEWLDGVWLEGPVVETMKPPCGAISIGISEGDYMHQPIRLSWHIHYVPSAVINLTIQEMAVPMLSIHCDYSLITIHGSSVKKRMCGKQWNQMYYSTTNFVIRFYANVLTENVTLCLSYAHGWYYEAPIADEDIHMLKSELLEESHLGYVFVQQQPDTNRKCLLAADFLEYNAFINVHISTGGSTVHVFDGPGRLSPLMAVVKQHSTFITDVLFYLYLDITTHLHDNETFISYQAVYRYYIQPHPDNFTQDTVQQCHNEPLWVPLKLSDRSHTMMVESKSEENIWCQVFLHGKGVTVHIDEFMFDGPAVQHIHKDFLTCQFGGLFLKIYEIDEYNVQVKYNLYNGLSICDDILRKDHIFMLGFGTFSVSVVYFAGYSQGAIKFRAESEHLLDAWVTHECNANLAFCIFRHNVWTVFETKIFREVIYADDVNILEVMNPPYMIPIPHESTAHMVPVLDVTAGSVSKPYSLGTVQVTIVVISEIKPLDTMCPVTIQLNMPPNKDMTSSEVSSVFSRKRTIVIPSAIYINVIVRLCPYLQRKDRLSVQVKVEKYQLCGVVDGQRWTTQIASNCSHLTLPVHLGNVSFHTELTHAYKLSINDACLDKSCLDITITGFTHGSNTHQCDVIWKHVDVLSSPMRIFMPGELFISWKKKASCVHSLAELRKCSLKIDITFYSAPSLPSESRYKHIHRTTEQISLYSNSRKDVILLKQ